MTFIVKAAEKEVFLHRFSSSFETKKKEDAVPPIHSYFFYQDKNNNTVLPTTVVVLFASVLVDFFETSYSSLNIKARQEERRSAKL